MDNYQYEDILIQLKKKLGDGDDVKSAIRDAWDELFEKILVRKKIPEKFFVYDTTLDSFYEEIQNYRPSEERNLSLALCPSPRHVQCVNYDQWEIFHNQLRNNTYPEGEILGIRRRTVILTCVILENGSRQCFTKENITQSSHAEEEAIAQLMKYQNITEVYICSSRSPCWKCCGQLEHFIQTKKIKKLRIRFATIYKHYEPENVPRLWKLQDDNKNIVDIGVMKKEDWTCLERHLTNADHNALRNKYWNQGTGQSPYKFTPEKHPYDEVDDIETKQKVKKLCITNSEERSECLNSTQPDIITLDDDSKEEIELSSS